MDSPSLLFLDFDGVLCDSLPETLACSWSAYFRYIRNEAPPAMPLHSKKQFLELRPFIRSGEDYIVLQDALYHQRLITNQTEFDQLVTVTGPERLRYYKDIFYAARQELLSNDKSFWLSLNPIFPPLCLALKKKPRHPLLYILSTKKSSFIIEILKANHLDFLEDNVIDSGNRIKIDIIRGILENKPGQRACFIDDQIDHLTNDRDPRIDVCLAAWGYVKAEWLQPPEPIQVISIEDAVRSIQALP
jgi:hypothetical protein